MAINTRQREAYRQALEAWRLAAREAQKIKDRIYGAVNTVEQMYVITDQELQLLSKESNLYQRLASAARNL
jgi:hypothetical protein